MSQLESNGPDREPNAGLVGLSGLLGSVISAGRDILARRRQNALEAPSSDLLEKVNSSFTIEERRQGWHWLARS